jgi:hypothetical protein
VKLLIEEPGSAAVRQLSAPWVRSVCSLVLYPEARAALAAARRAGRIGGGEHRRALEMLEQLWRRSDRLRVTTALARRAGDLAERHALRGYDAVHLASFEMVADDDALLVTFDEELRRAAHAIGFNVAPRPA